VRMATLRPATSSLPWCGARLQRAGAVDSGWVREGNEIMSKFVARGGPGNAQLGTDLAQG
jgi:hypothetical protein